MKRRKIFSCSSGVVGEGAGLSVLGRDSGAGVPAEVGALSVGC